MKAHRIKLLFAAVFYFTLFFGSIISTWAQSPVREPEVLAIPENLATPAVDYKYLIPVVIIVYLPTKDDVTLESSVTGFSATIGEIGQKIDVMNQQIKFALEEGSRYHGYKDPQAKPSLGYKVVGCIAVYEPLPRSNFEVPWNKGIYRPDYKRILTRFDARNFVEKLGVKEFWIWGYQHDGVEPSESNMSSPVTGDISNSERADDLPVFSKTYVLYNYNYERTAAEAIHNHGHHLEAVLSYINQRQDGNTDLWSKKFMGQDAAGQWMTGRCGWTHMPPNTVKDYDYENQTPVESDIEDWNPGRTGVSKTVNARSWGSLTYAWPHRRPPLQKTEAQWYLYWRQNVPGSDNKIPFGSGSLTNWWQFIGDWNNAIANNVGLHAPSN